MRSVSKFSRLLLLGLIASASSVEANESRRISLDLAGADLHNVFRLLADVGKVNVVVPDEVKGKITLKLVEVPWKEALLVVLQTSGLGLEKSGNVYFVDTLERITDRAETQARLASARKSVAPLKTVIIALSYAKAKDLAPIVRGLLTERGKVQVDERTNVLIVTDVAEVAEHVEETMGSRTH